MLSPAFTERARAHTGSTDRFVFGSVGREAASCEWDRVEGVSETAETSLTGVLKTDCTIGGGEIVA